MTVLRAMCCKKLYPFQKKRTIPVPNPTADKTKAIPFFPRLAACPKIELVASGWVGFTTVT
jgi:hypothetical protein